MFKLMLIGGLLTVFSFSDLSIASVFLGMIGLGAMLFMLAIALGFVAVVLERVARWSGGMHHADPRRLRRSRLIT